MYKLKNEKLSEYQITMIPSTEGENPEQVRRIISYQALWRPQDKKGHFWFTYFDGRRERSMDLDAESFRIILKVIDTNKPIFANHLTSTVAIHSQQNDLKVGAWS